MSNKSLVITIVVIVLVAVGGVLAFRNRNSNQTDSFSYNSNQSPTPTGQNAPTDTPANSTSTQANTTPMDTTCKRDFSQAKLDGNAKIAIANRTVEINVANFGKIQLEFYDKDAPKTVANFLRLTDSGYYDCLTFHRVAKGFVIQGGDPNGNGSGGQSAYGGPFADELNPSTASYKAGYVKGVLAMANSGHNTNGSQFFIMLDDVPLSHDYTIFGKVTVGLDVVDKIGQVEITPQMGATDGSPVTPIVMQSVKIIK